MRLTILVGVLVSLAAAPPALAQSGPAPARCDVHILRAPDAVRARVEGRVRREPRCETSLVVRIVPTTAGLYLLAHTPNGRLYEMVVPDAETAAELVATWAVRREQPAAAPPVPPLAPPAIAPPPVEARPAIGSDASIYEVPRVRPPGIMPEAPPSAASRARSGQWLAVAAIVGADVRGIRGELDLGSRAGWSVGLAIAYSEMQMTRAPSAFEMATLDFADLRGVVTAGYTLGRGTLRLRGQASLGVVRTEMTGFGSTLGPFSYSGVHAIGEAAAHVHLAFGRDRAWAVSGGPTLTIYSQTYQLTNGVASQQAERTLDVSFVGGLRRRL